MPCTPAVRPAAILVDRHLEKNGGTTFNRVMHAAEAEGYCVFYALANSAEFRKVLDTLRNLTSDEPPPRLCIEAHAYIDYSGYAWTQRLVDLAELRPLYARRNVPARLVFNVRLRRPLDHYLSFYVWIVAGRQIQKPEVGRNFTEWALATPNLQSELLVDSRMGQEASFGSIYSSRREWLERWGFEAGKSPPDAAVQNSTAQARRAWTALLSYDSFGTTDRFAASNRLLFGKLGWRARTLQKVAPVTVGPGLPHACAMEGASDPRCTIFRRGGSIRAKQRLLRSQACPDMRECERIVRSVAAVDWMLYETADAALSKALAEPAP